MYKHLAKQIVQQKVHNNYVVPLIKQSVFTKLVEFLYLQLEYSNDVFTCLTKPKHEENCSVMNFVVQFQLRARENKFRIAIYRKLHFVMISDIHFQVLRFRIYIFEFLHPLVFIFCYVYWKVNEMLIQISVVDKTDVDMLIQIKCDEYENGI